jgi:trehalose 6-phosphate phosphatase
VHLPESATVAGRSGLVALIAEPARALVAVDFDGTLAPIVVDPDDARPASGAAEALAALAARIGTVAIVTGRPATVAVELGGFATVPGLWVLGHYGLERWHDGALDSPPPDPAVDEVRRRLAGILADAPEGVRIEDKLHSLVVHTRPTADPGATLSALAPRLEQLARGLGLETVPGRLAVEIRPAGVDKGSAFARLVQERESRAIVFIGDDVADLPAFSVVESLRHDGVPGLTVASVDPEVDDAPAELARRADLVLPGPAAVVQFLHALASALGDS